MQQQPGERRQQEGDDADGPSTFRRSHKVAPTSTHDSCEQDVQGIAMHRLLDAMVCPVTLLPNFLLRQFGGAGGTITAGDVSQVADRQQAIPSSHPGKSEVLYATFEFAHFFRENQ